MTKQLSGFEKLKAKYSELNGGAPGDRFTWRVDPNAEDSQTFAILNPLMMDEETEDEFAHLKASAAEGELLPSEMSSETLDLFIRDDERDDFEELARSGGMRPIRLLNMIIEEFQEKRAPTRPTSSRRSRR